MRLSCLARNGRSPGEESLTAAIAAQAIEAQPAFGQIKPMRGQVLACAEQHFGDVPASDRLTQEAPRSRRRKRKPGVQKGRPTCRRADRSQRRRRRRTGLQSAEEIARLNRSVREDRDIAISIDDRLFSVIPTERRRTRIVTRPWSSPQSATELGLRATPGSESGLGQDRHARPGGAPDSDGAKNGEHFPPPFRGNTNMCKGKGHIIAGACRRKRE